MLNYVNKDVVKFFLSVVRQIKGLKIVTHISKNKFAYNSIFFHTNSNKPGQSFFEEVARVWDLLMVKNTYFQNGELWAATDKQDPFSTPCL